MDIKSLQTLVAIADCGSFVQAAAHLGVSIATVSLHVSALEKSLQRQLFDRSSRPPTLTIAGRSLVQEARELLLQWDRLRAGVEPEVVGKVLTFGAVHTQVRYLVPRALRSLQQHHPEINCRLVTGLSHDLVERVMRGNLDCAVVTVSAALPLDLTAFELVSEPLVVIAPAAAKEQQARALLENNPYVKFNPDALVAQIIDNLLVDRGINVNPTMEIDTLDAVISLVSHGLGVSVVPRLNDFGADARHLRSVRFSRSRFSRQVGLVMRKDSPNAEMIGQLFTALSEHVKR